MRDPKSALACAAAALVLCLSTAFDSRAATVDDGTWTMPARDYASTRFSPLTQLDTRNVAKLQVEFTFSTGVNRGQEAAPIVVDDTMYLVTPFPNRVYALDLTQPGAPVKWTFDPKVAPAAQGVACCDVVNRGAAYADGRIFFTTLDGQALALDAVSGAEQWRVKLANYNVGETITMAPLVVKGKVLVGNAGGELGVRGWLAALDADSGRLAWKAYSTGPDRDVLIGAAFKPFYPTERGKDLGQTTWPPGAWQTGGGTVWGWISYDPVLDLIFYGTGNPGPWNAEMRPGDNKWSSGMFARDPDDGQARWAYQFSPHDLFDYDAINESVLLDLPWGGSGGMRKVLVRPERNGFVYVMDRATGEVLAADPFVPVNSITHIDLATGRAEYNPAKRPTTGRTTREICPAAPGAKDWNPAAYSKRTGLLYIPHNNLCMDWSPTEVSYIAGTPYVGVDTKFYAGPGGHRGLFTAWDPLRRRVAWQVKEDLPVWSGALVTAGDLVFYGTMDGWFKALDARDGKLLWQFKTDSGIIGQPVSYRGPDGRQYVAILSGVGGWSGAIVVANLDARDETAGGGFANALKDLKQRTTAGGTLYVFALPAR
ncbi:MAG TPA: methanol/ethanol family PQQ-dependent dehydrogenase [Steroidobacteraceae bacterium]|nr:methanol/ethanol family PQQ-dependent dehydrogenase [Steroidobacteraceae bacterium]